MIGYDVLQLSSLEELYEDLFECEQNLFSEQNPKEEKKLEEACNYISSKIEIGLKRETPASVCRLLYIRLNQLISLQEKLLTIKSEIEKNQLVVTDVLEKEKLVLQHRKICKHQTKFRVEYDKLQQQLND